MVDVVIVLADPKRTRINAREVSLYDQLFQRHKAKTHMYVYLTGELPHVIIP